MERVVFLVEGTATRIPCLLNPETVVQRRYAGVRPTASVGGLVTGTGLSDDPLLHTGGGRTELDLDLLFDVSLAGGPTPITDVRDLTRPLWELAENRTDRSVPWCRFLWGKPWNVLGVIESVAERLERFTLTGAPTRSWLRLRFVRVPEPPAPATDPISGLPLAQVDPATGAAATANIAGAAATAVHEVIGAGPQAAEGARAGGERLDAIAAMHYGGQSWLWRLIAAANDLADPPWVTPGTNLVIPAAPAAAATSAAATATATAASTSSTEAHP